MTDSQHFSMTAVSELHNLVTRSGNQARHPKLGGAAENTTERIGPSVEKDVANISGSQPTMSQTSSNALCKIVASFSFLAINSFYRSSFLGGVEAYVLPLIFQSVAKTRTRYRCCWIVPNGPGRRHDSRGGRPSAGSRARDDRRATVTLFPPRRCRGGTSTLLRSRGDNIQEPADKRIREAWSSREIASRTRVPGQCRTL